MEVFMETKIDLKKKCLMLLIAMCLILMTSCSLLTKQNPNVKTPLDAAKVTYDASCNWYVGVYSDIVMLNKDPYLSENAQKVLKNEVNPAMDRYKHMLIEYGTLIEQIEAGRILSAIGDSALLLKAEELNIMKQSIIGLVLAINQLQNIKGD
jgi:hypothetical protein